MCFLGRQQNQFLFGIRQRHRHQQLTNRHRRRRLQPNNQLMLFLLAQSMLTMF
jgi:hypothetical protein